MKKQILILASLLMATTLQLQAQINNTGKSIQELLTSTVWEQQFEEHTVDSISDLRVCTVFSKDSTENHFIGRNWNPSKISKDAYYLSETKDSEFDSSKVGKNSNGKYLIIEDSRNFYNYEILEISRDHVKLKFSNNYRNNNDIVIYKASSM